MANVINRTTLQFIASANTPEFPEPTWKANPDMTQVAGIAQRYWKWDVPGDRPVSMTAPEQAAVDLALLTAQRDNAVVQLQAIESVTRAFMLVVLDEFNAHTAKTNSLLTAIDNAVSLASLQTAVAAIVDLPVRTEQQLRTAIRNKLGS